MSASITRAGVTASSIALRFTLRIASGAMRSVRRPVNLVSDRLTPAIVPESTPGVKWSCARVYSRLFATPSHHST